MDGLIRSKWRNFLSVLSLGPAILAFLTGANPAFAEIFGGNDPLIRQTQSGLVKGFVDGRTWAFKGIPYAAPPVGILRWAVPSAPFSWSGIRGAETYGAVCPQISRGGPISFIGGSSDLGGQPAKVVGSEDCLFLNIWIPKPKILAPERPLPVMVFIHGGGNDTGASSDELLGAQFYNGSGLASRGPVVIVTLNYRLGPLGFMAHPSLTDNAGATGNYGLYDQLAALRWVQKNIAQFDGDPQQVMLFGESAGALDSLLLYTSPLARGLFSKVLLESPQYLFPFPSRTALARSAGTVTTALGCGRALDVAACLRSKSIHDLLAAKGESDLAFPTVDGKLIVEPPETALKAGHQNPVPLIIGGNGNELTYVWPNMVKAAGLSWPPKTEAEFQDHLHQFFGSAADQVAAEYAGVGTDQISEELEIASDFGMICPLNRIAHEALVTQNEPVWQYLYNHVYSDSHLAVFKAAHAFELPMVFGSFPVPPYSFLVRITLAERALSRTIQGYWTRFAIQGDPNGDSAVLWPALAKANDAHLNLDLRPSADRAGFHHCDFWAQHTGIAVPAGGEQGPQPTVEPLSSR